MNKTIFLLIKFAEKYEHVKELQKGKLYMRSVKYYRELEEKQLNLRGDENEGVRSLLYNSKIIVRCKSSPKPIVIEPKELNGSIKVIMNKDLYRYAYCMYSLYFNGDYICEEDFNINEKVKEFGDWFLMITDVSEFFRRVDSKLNILNIGYKRDLINYKDLSHGNIKSSPFIKDLKYNYQEEYRILLDYYKDPSYRLDIGDVSDISIIGKIEDLFNKNIFNIQMIER